MINQTVKWATHVWALNGIFVVIGLTVIAP